MKRILVIGAILVVVIAIQFVPVDRGAAAALSVEAPAQVMDVIETSCADCHSGATRWPWYGRVAPISWIVAHHVAEGREHVDFSRWQDVDAGRRSHWLEEIVEVIETGEMPPGYYTAMHGDADLDVRSRELLLRWARDGASGH